MASFESKIRETFAASNVDEIKKALEQYRKGRVEEAVEAAKKICDVDGTVVTKAGDVLANRLDFMDDERIAQYLAQYNSKQDKPVPIEELVQPGPGMLYAIETRYRNLEVYMYEIEMQVEKANNIFDGVSTVKDTITGAGRKVGNLLGRIKRTKTFQDISATVKDAASQVKEGLKDPMEQVKQELELDKLDLSMPEGVEQAKAYPAFVKEVVRQYAILLAQGVDEMKKYQSE